MFLAMHLDGMGCLWSQIIAVYIHHANKTYSCTACTRSLLFSPQYGLSLRWYTSCVSSRESLASSAHRFCKSLDHITWLPPGPSFCFMSLANTRQQQQTVNIDYGTYANIDSCELRVCLGNKSPGTFHSYWLIDSPTHRRVMEDS